MKTYWTTFAREVKKASTEIALANTATKNLFLDTLYHEILAHEESILKENEKDLENARNKNFDEAFIDRLALNRERVQAMADGVKEMVLLPDPIGEITNIKSRPSGIQVGKMRVPLGVIGIIYEARPNVTIDAAALCIKSGNGAILRGGSEAFHTNQYLGHLLKEALGKAGLPPHGIGVVETTDRALVDLMISSPQYIDIIIPRGGKSLIERISAAATVPVLKHLDGVCHTYVDKEANLAQALSVVDNAKTQRYAPCNAMETLLIHQEVAPVFLAKIGKIFAEKGVEMRGCNVSYNLLKEESLPVVKATEEDWSAEYLAPIIAIKIVTSLDEAIEHISTYGSQHTDVIITENYTKALTFLRAVDSACVMVNASSRFSDGFEFGLGAEIGISTDKLHARGPVGLEGLTSQKYIVLGHGEGRQ